MCAAKPAVPRGCPAREGEAGGAGRYRCPGQPVPRVDREQDDRRDEQWDDEEAEADAAEQGSEEDDQEDETGGPELLPGRP